MKTKARFLPIGVCALLLSQSVFAASTWDVHPTPLEQLESAGVVPSVSAVTEILFDRTQSTELRATAALALAQLKDESSIPMLIKAASDRDSDVRTAAISALGFIPSESSIDLLRNTLINDLESMPRSAAVIALQMIGTDEAASVLTIAALNEYETENTRISALNAIGQIGRKRDLDDVAVLANHENPNIRGKSALIFSQRGNSQHLEKLVSAAMDKDMDYGIYMEAIEHLEKVSGRDFKSTAESREMSRRQIADWWNNNPEEELVEQ